MIPEKAGYSQIGYLYSFGTFGLGICQGQTLGSEGRGGHSFSEACSLPVSTSKNIALISDTFLPSPVVAIIPHPAAEPGSVGKDENLLLVQQVAW